MTQQRLLNPARGPRDREIHTRYTSNARGTGQVRATYKGKSLSTEIDHALNIEQNHRTAAQRLASKLGLSIDAEPSGELRHRSGRGFGGLSWRVRESNPSRRSVHTKAWDDCVRDVKRRGDAASAYAVCTSALGERGSIKAGHRRKNPSGFDLEKTTRIYFMVHAHKGRERLWLTPSGTLSADKARGARYTSVEVAVARAKAFLKKHRLARKYRFDVCMSD